ncbi:MAG: RnfH family protein [Sphaerotilus natans]
MADADAGAAPAPMQVEVAFSPAPRQVDRVTLQLAAGATAAQALAASGLAARHAALGAVGEGGLAFGIGGRAVAPDTPMQPGDRLDICRALKVDPKEARRLRYRAQGERGRQRVSGSRSR